MSELPPVHYTPYFMSWTQCTQAASPAIASPVTRHLHCNRRTKACAGVLPESSHPAIIGTAKQTPQGVSVSWCEWGNWMSNPRHEHPTKRAKSDSWSLFRGNQRMPNNARGGGLWMRHRNSEQYFIGTEKTGKLPSVSETVLLPTVVLWHPS